MARMKKRPEPIINYGDVYKFKLKQELCNQKIEDDLFGLIQIFDTSEESNIGIIVYEKIYKENEINLEKLIFDNILFFGRTYDSRIYHDLWEFVGNEQKSILRVKLPYYKIGLLDDGSGRIVDYYGNYIRHATEFEYNNLNYKSTCDPYPFEKFLLKYHNLLLNPDKIDESKYFNYEEKLFSYIEKSIFLVEYKNENKQNQIMN